MKGIDKIFWINHRNRPDRFRTMKERLTSLDINAERFDALNGGTVDWRDSNFNFYSMNRTKKDLNNAEIGCFLSHRNIYQAIKKEGWKKTLIFEDDCAFPENFIETFEELYKNVPEFDMLYLGQWNYDKGVVQGETSALKDKIADVGDKKIYSAERCWLTHAYIVDNSIIDILLDNTKNMYGSIDWVLADIQEQNKLKVYAIHPNLINQDLSPSSLR